MWLSLVGPELVSVIAVLVLLFGVPVLVIAVLAVVSGYIQYDAERRIEALEDEARNEVTEEPRESKDKR
jgi:hypothetical protein